MSEKNTYNDRELGQYFADIKHQLSRLENDNNAGFKKVHDRLLFFGEVTQLISWNQVVFVPRGVTHESSRGFEFFFLCLIVTAMARLAKLPVVISVMGVCKALFQRPLKAGRFACTLFTFTRRSATEVLMQPVVKCFIGSAIALPCRVFITTKTILLKFKFALKRTGFGGFLTTLKNHKGFTTTQTWQRNHIYILSITV